MLVKFSILLVKYSTIHKVSSDYISIRNVLTQAVVRLEEVY